MRKKRAFIISIILTAALASSAFAADGRQNGRDEPDLPKVTVPVKVTLTGTPPDIPEEFKFELKAEDPAYPMQEGSKDGVYIMQIKGEGTKDFPQIVYDRAGVYTYTIRQIPGTNKKCRYDDKVYTLTVYITNAEDGVGLGSTAVLRPDTEGVKEPEAVFTNEYETGPEVPTTGDTADVCVYIMLAAASLIMSAVLIAAAGRGKNNINK